MSTGLHSWYLDTTNILQLQQKMTNLYGLRPLNLIVFRMRLILRLRLLEKPTRQGGRYPTVSLEHRGLYCNLYTIIFEGFFTKSTIDILKLAEMVELHKQVRTFLI